MAVSFVGAQGNAGTTVTIPTHQSGDLILIFAYRDNSSSTPPSTPAAGGTVPTWILINSGAGASNASNFRYAIATSNTTTSGTWTNAQEIVCLVYRGATIGASAANSNSTAGTTINYPALTLDRTNNTSWVAAVAGQRTATNVEQAPSGMTNRVSAGTESAGHDTNGTVSSWSSTNVTVNSSNFYRSCVVELHSADLTISADAQSFAVSGKDATLTKSTQQNYSISAEKAAFVLTGNAVQFPLFAGVGSFALSGQTAELKHARLTSAATGEFALTGVAAQFPLFGTSVSFSVTGQEAALRQDRKLPVTTSVFAVDGQDATLQPARKVLSSTGGFTVQGQDADLTYVFNTGYTITADASSFNTSGVNVALLFNRLVSASAGTFVYTGIAAGLNGQARIYGETGSFLQSGQDCALLTTRRVSGNPGSYGLSGQDAAVTRIPRRNMLVF